MNDWKKTLRVEHGELVAGVEVTLLQKHEAIRLHFEGAAELTPEAEAAVETLLQSLPDLQEAIKEAAFEYYQAIREELGDTQCQELDVPLVADKVALLPYYQLYAIYLPEEPETGRFGLGFNCDWEEEHGFGLQFRNWQIVEVGGDAEAFSFYD